MMTTPAQKKEIVFLYKASNKTGKRVSGEITAPNTNMAKAMLRKRDFSKIKLTKQLKLPFASKEKSISSKEITYTTRQLATMNRAGIPFVQALDVVSEGSQNDGLKKLLKDIKMDIENGMAFSEVLKKYPNHFDNLYCSLTLAGENSGNLDVMLERIATYREKTETLKRKLKKAITYPAAVVVVSIIVSVILLVKVVPTFENLFSGFGADLPGFTLAVLKLSELLQKHGLLLSAGFAVFVVLLIYLYRNKPPFRHLIERLSLKIPVFGALIKKAIIARFARTLSTTFAAGMPLTDALESVARISGNIVYYVAILQVKESIVSGEKIYSAMRETRVFPDMVVEMIGIGEESGTLETMLEKIASIYEEEVDVMVDGLSTLIEPFIMVLLGLIVGGLVIAMYLPIFKLGAIM